MTIKPADVWIDEIGVLTDAFGKTEAEAAAAVIVRYHQAKSLEEWTEVTPRQLADFMGEDELTRHWARNPFWRPAPWLLERWGLVTPWEADTPLRFTEKALHALEHRGAWKEWPKR